MRRASLALAALTLTACYTELETPGLDDHELEVTVAGERLKSTFTLIDGFYESPVMETPEGASRVAAMLTLTDVPVDIDNRLEARIIRADGSTTEWLPLEVTFNEEELRVIRVDLGELGNSVQLRVPQEDADLIRLLTWSAASPVDPGDEAGDEGITVVSNEEEQALNGELAAAGILPRSAWNARPTRCSSRDRAKERIAVHHTAGAPTAGGSYEAALRQIQAYHMDGRGYCDAGYHFAVTLDGRVWELRPLEYLGGHSRSYNGGNAGIVMVGCFDSAACAGVSGPRRPSDAMVHGVARAISALSGMFGIAINSDRVKGHGQQPYQQTGCPGDGGRARLEEIRALARGGAAPAPAPAPPPSDGQCGQVRVDTSGGSLNMRPTASTAGAAVGSLPDGATVTRLQSVQGQSINGDRTWHKVRRNDGLVGFIAGAYARCVASAPPPPPPPSNPAPASCGFLGPNQVLARGQAVDSCNGRFRFAHQGDGNIVLYKLSTGQALWHTATHGRSTGNLVMQGDGNLVLYTPGGTALWHTGTHRNNGATLAVQGDGNVVIYAPGNRAVWHTGTFGN